MEYRPPWGVCDFIMRKACWAHKNEPVRLVWTQPIQSSYVISSNGTGGVPVPALLNLLKERNMAGPRSTATRVYEVGNAGRGKGGKPDVQNVNTAELAAHRIKQCGHGRGIRHIGYARVRIFRRTTCCRSSRKSSLENRRRWHRRATAYLSRLSPAPGLPLASPPGRPVWQS
jgi:hypothetical protein